jgi:hypothetical protein
VDKVGRGKEVRQNEKEEAIRKIIKMKEGIIGGRRGGVKRDEAERGHQWNGGEDCFLPSWAWRAVPSPGQYVQGNGRG